MILLKEVKSPLRSGFRSGAVECHLCRLSGPEALAGGEDAWAMRVWRATQEMDGTGSRLLSSVRRAASWALGRQGTREQGPGSFS